MKKLHLLVIKSFVGPLILTFFFVVFILLMQFLWRYIDDLIGKGLEFTVISEFLVYTSATLVPLAVPLAVLLASLMTFGNMAENLELLAFKSSGISLVRIMAPVIILSTIIAVSAFIFANTLLPYSNLRMRSLLYDIQQQRPELTIKPGIFDNNLEGYSIRIGDKDPKTSLLKDILIFDHTEKKGNINVTLADSGYMRMSADEKHLLLTLYHGKSYVEMQKQKKEDRHVKSYPLRRDYFDEREIIIEMTGFGLNRSDEKLFRNSYSMLNLEQLHHFEDSLTGDLNKALDKFYGVLTKSLTGKSKSVLIKPDAQNKKLTQLERSQLQRADKQPPPRPRPRVPGRATQAHVPRSTTDSAEAAALGALHDSDPMADRIRMADSVRMAESARVADSTRVADSIALAALPPPRILALHVDSAYALLDKLEQRRAVTQALSYARSNKSVVNSNVGTAEWKISRLRRYQIEIHRKYTLSLLCLIFFFIGAPMGAIIRKGGLGMPVIASVLMFLFYYIISMMGEKSARESVISPFFGMWLSTFILVPISIWLTYKAANDSVVLNIDTYFTWFRKTREKLGKRNRRR